jgi:hypothetical protein
LNGKFLWAATFRKFQHIDPQRAPPWNQGGYLAYLIEPHRPGRAGWLVWRGLRERCQSCGSNKHERQANATQFLHFPLVQT